MATEQLILRRKLRARILLGILILFSTAWAIIGDQKVIALILLILFLLDIPVIFFGRVQLLNAELCSCSWRKRQCIDIANLRTLSLRREVYTRLAYPVTLRLSDASGQGLS